MTPLELADRLAALDWSGTSLQHQLAVGCAISTLRALEKEPTAPKSSNVVELPCQHTIRLLDLAGTEFARQSFRDIRKAWGWVQEVVATGWHCPVHQVDCAAGWNGVDVVTVGGAAVAQVAHGLQEPFGRR